MSQRFGWHLIACLLPDRPMGLRCRAGRHLWSLVTEPVQCCRCRRRAR